MVCLVRRKDHFGQRSTRSQVTGSPFWYMGLDNTPQTKICSWPGRNCVWILSRFNFIVPLKHWRDRRGLLHGLLLRKHILCLTSVQGKGRGKTTHLCVYLATQKMDGHPPRLLMLRAEHHEEQIESPKVQARTFPTLLTGPWSPAVILQSIRKRNMDGEPAACSSWDSCGCGWRPSIQSQSTARPEHFGQEWS